LLKNGNLKLKTAKNFWKMEVKDQKIIKNKQSCTQIC
jgi:hypothetical protein